MVIGRSDAADLILDDRYVSRRHALVSVTANGSVTIHDLNSTGGTFVNDERLTGPRVLQPGDVVRFAGLAARFEPAVERDTETAVLPETRLPDATQVIDRPVPATGGFFGLVAGAAF
jgi:pSer/pThr/pTyr-binding forkhead associated (FHA) protein